MFGFQESEAVIEETPPHFRFAFGGNAQVIQNEVAMGASVPIQGG